MTSEIDQGQIQALEQRIASSEARWGQLSAALDNRKFWSIALLVTFGIWLVLFTVDLVWRYEPDWLDTARAIAQLLVFISIWFWVNARLAVLEQATTGLAEIVDRTRREIRR